MTIAADSGPAVAPSKRERLILLLRGLRATSLDAVAHLSMAISIRRLAIEADTVHDRSLARCLYVAGVGAREAELKGCGCAPRFDRVIELGLAAQKADAVEDGHLGLAFGEVENGRGRIRVVAGRFDRLLSGRADS